MPRSASLQITIVAPASPYSAAAASSPGRTTTTTRVSAACRLRSDARPIGVPLARRCSSLPPPKRRAAPAASKIPLITKRVTTASAPDRLGAYSRVTPSVRPGEEDQHGGCHQQKRNHHHHSGQRENDPAHGGGYDDADQRQNNEQDNRQRRNGHGNGCQTEEQPGYRITCITRRQTNSQLFHCTIP